VNAVGMAPPREGKGIDHVLLAVIIVLTVIGVITVYSAGSERSVALYDSPHKMFLNQFTRALAGFVLLAITSLIPFGVWKKLAIPLLGIATILLMLLFVDGVGETSKGATRWLKIGVRFQPSELARYALVIFLAWWANRKGQLMGRLSDGILIPLGITGAIAGMILLQPDFSTSFMLIMTALMILYVAGVKLVHLAMTLSPLAVGGFLVIWLSDYKRERLMSFLSPLNDPENSGYQILQSFIGLGRGGLFGAGIGGSRQKLLFLPDAHTDFIFSIVGEEMGLMGTGLLLVLFIVLMIRGFRIATKCKDPFGSYLAAGITFSIGLYAFVNMAITVGVLPATGLPLPLVSYGGTSLMVTLAALGIVLNISKYGSENIRSAHAGGRR
jgi:cell division protein FtsW